MNGASLPTGLAVTAMLNLPEAVSMVWKIVADQSELEQAEMLAEAFEMVCDASSLRRETLSSSQVDGALLLLVRLVQSEPNVLRRALRVSYEAGISELFVNKMIKRKAASQSVDAVLKNLGADAVFLAENVADIVAEAAYTGDETLLAAVVSCEHLVPVGLNCPDLYGNMPLVAWLHATLLDAQKPDFERFLRGVQVMCQAGLDVANFLYDEGWTALEKVQVLLSEGALSGEQMTELERLLTPYASA
jgi:hypothetical protein